MWRLRKNKMKKVIYGSLIGICLTLLVACTVANYEPKKATGEVEQIEGLYIFTDSKPVLKYEQLGQVKISYSIEKQYQDARYDLIKKVKNDFPTAEGLIMLIESADTASYRANAIKFK